MLRPPTLTTAALLFLARTRTLPPILLIVAPDRPSLYRHASSDFSIEVVIKEHGVEVSRQVLVC